MHNSIRRSEAESIFRLILVISVAIGLTSAYGQKPALQPLAARDLEYSEARGTAEALQTQQPSAIVQSASAYAAAPAFTDSFGHSFDELDEAELEELLVRRRQHRLAAASRDPTLRAPVAIGQEPYSMRAVRSTSGASAQAEVSYGNYDENMNQGPHASASAQTVLSANQNQEQPLWQPYLESRVQPGFAISEQPQTSNYQTGTPHGPESYWTYKQQPNAIYNSDIEAQSEFFVTAKTIDQAIPVYQEAQVEPETRNLEPIPTGSRYFGRHGYSKKQLAKKAAEKVSEKMSEYGINQGTLLKLGASVIRGRPSTKTLLSLGYSIGKILV